MRSALKPTWFIVGLLFYYSLSFAGPVETGRAKSVASTFLGISSSEIGSIQKLSVEGSKVHESVQDRVSLYVLTPNKGGFVIVSGDDSISPILGYSNTGDFPIEKIPDNVRSWIIETGYEIQNAVSGKKVASPIVEEEWRLLEGGSTVNVLKANGVLLETALWDQGEPYNLLCPTQNGRRTYSGCVATAMAIILYYHQSPTHGTGRIPEYSYIDGSKTIIVPGIELGYDYDWENMLNIYNAGYYSERQAEAVAVLMRDCGHMVKMTYGVNSSGAYFKDILPPLKSFMNYSKDAIEAYRTDYSQEGWTALIKEDINNNLPVLYTATSMADGHAFVLDGYDSNGYFHINWGWSGNSNGYFRLPAFNEFIYNHSAIFHLSPGAPAPPQPALRLISGLNAGNFSFDSEADIINTPFEVSFSICGIAADPFVGDVAVGLYDRSNSFHGIISQVDRVSLSNANPEYKSALTCILSETPKIGDRIRLSCRVDGSNKWLPITAGDNADIADRILVAEEYSLDEVSTISFSIDNRKLSVSTKQYTDYSFQTSAGIELFSGNTDHQTTFSFDCRTLSSGAYLLIISKGNDTKCVRIVL